MKIKNLLLRFIRLIYTIVGIMFLVVLTACSATDDVSVPDVQQPQTETVEPEKSQTTEPKPESFDGYEDYIDYISDIPEFEPYYKTVFAFEELSDGIKSVPIEEVKAMYDEMKTAFNYVLVNEYPLVYRGNYEGETSFVDGYEEYQAAGNDKVISNPVNVVSLDQEGNEFLTTPLKTILLGEDTFNHFDNSIDVGRNLKKSDFTLEAPNKPISVVLGNAYKDIYKIGDIFSLELISEVMDFQVVGIYKSGVGFSMNVGALQDVNLDHTIVMPHFIPDYKPVGEAAVFQHAYHIGELLSGYIRIPESVEKINEDTYEHTMDMIDEVAQRNNISGLYKMPYWPVGFVW